MRKVALLVGVLALLAGGVAGAVEGPAPPAGNPVASLAASLPPQYRDAVAYPFVLPTFEVATEGYVPRAAAVGQPVMITACRGEYEPGSLFVLAKTDLAAVTVEIPPLHCGDVVLDPANFDPYLLKDWYQAGAGSFIEDKPVFVPELLLKDPDIVTPNHQTQRNDFNFDPAVGPEVGAVLKPVHIPTGQNRQFWVVLHVPGDQPAGKYFGQVHLLNAGQPIGEVPLEVTVLPLKLEKADATFSMMNHRQYTNGKDSVSDGFYKAMLAMCARYQMDSLYVQEGGSIVAEGAGYKIDMPLTRAAFELRKQYGLTGPTAYNGLHWMVPQLSPAIWEMKAAQLREPNNPVCAVFVAYCRELKRVAAEAGMPDPLVYTHDEPGYDATGERLEEARLINALVQKAGLRSTEANTPDGSRKLGPNLDLPVVDLLGELPQGLGTRAALPGIPHCWWYWHPMENPTHDRLANGLVTWYLKFDGTAPYALASLGGWDDWKGAGTYRPERYIYDGHNAPIPTLELEAYREGVDDYRYLNMIDRRLHALAGRRLSPAGQAVVADAQELVGHCPAPFAGWKLNDLAFERRITGADWAALRAHMQDLVVKLDALAHP